jgi:hypothetical protein
MHSQPLIPSARVSGCIEGHERLFEVFLLPLNYSVIFSFFPLMSLDTFFLRDASLRKNTRDERYGKKP